MSRWSGQFSADYTRSPVWPMTLVPDKLFGAMKANPERRKNLHGHPGAVRDKGKCTRGTAHQRRRRGRRRQGCPAGTGDPRYHGNPRHEHQHDGLSTWAVGADCWSVPTVPQRLSSSCPRNSDRAPTTSAGRYRAWRLRTRQGRRRCAVQRLRRRVSVRQRASDSSDANREPGGTCRQVHDPSPAGTRPELQQAQQPTTTPGEAPSG